MLDKKELTQVRDYVIEILPELLRREPGIVRTIDHIIAEQFPRRDEFARLLDEVKAERLAAQERSEQVDARFEEQREETNRGFAALRAEMNQRFGQVDARFEQVDARFDQVDARFEQVDARFEEHHRILLDLKRGVLKLQQGQESLIKQMEAQEKWIRLKIGEIGNEKGESAEDFFAEGLRYGLKNPNISADKIRLRQPLVDTEGVVFKQPFASEVDLIIDNDQLIVFEIKSGRVKVGDVSFFSLKVGVVAAQNPDKQVRGALIAPFAGDDVRQRCLELGVELVD
jgi:hypothetical protein